MKTTCIVSNYLNYLLSLKLLDSFVYTNAVNLGRVNQRNVL